MEDSVEIVIEKLLHVTKDIIPKVTVLSILKLLLLVFTHLKLLPLPCTFIFRFQMMQRIA